MIPWFTLLGAAALADPCGMVPPIYTGPGPAPVGIERQGLQQTYVFFRDGVQTIAIRPGFTGDVEEFGMLVPLPAVPALRKIDDRTFTHLAAAVDPPPLTVHAVDAGMFARSAGVLGALGYLDGAASGLQFQADAVSVLKEEAVGMYEVAVLEAGSSAALKRWMDEHGFRYPDGMDRTVEDYVAARWMFVAIKTRVADAAGTQPVAGMRAVDTGLPPGGRFDGQVQGMAFRFEVDTPVIPMRLSTFNGDDTHNRVYVLSDRPVRLAEVPAELVRRQVSGRTLHGNLTEPLPLRFAEGSTRDLDDDVRATLDPLRDPDPYVVAARDLFASDVMAVAQGALSLPFEETEKELLRINEALGLRGAAVDASVEAVVADARGAALAPAVAEVFEMTLTVVDGDFPRAALAEDNLHLVAYDMPPRRNRFEVWNDRPTGPEHWIYLSGGVPW